MKLLKTLTHPDYPTLNIETHNRKAARIVLVDENNMVPLLYSSKYDVYIIPGGGVDPGESIIDAVHREVMEEVGCEIEILGEIGRVIDERPATVCKFGKNLVQTSYCYYGRVLSKSDHDLTEEEIEQGYELIWLSIEEVLDKMKNTKARIPKAEIEGKRDAYIFEEYLNIAQG